MTPMSLINWYPGHIAKAQNSLKEKLKLIDFVIELVDARLPEGSRFDVTNVLLGEKPRLLVFTKADMAIHVRTRAWLAEYQGRGQPTVLINAQTGEGLTKLTKIMQVEADKVTAKMIARGRLPRASRVMVVGLPNVGKSSLINKVAKKRTAKVGDKPGITRDVRWIKLGKSLELLDTPGIIPPKFEDQELALRLAMIGAVSTEAYDPILVAPAAIEVLAHYAPETLSGLPEFTIAAYARKRGIVLPGNEPDILRASRMFLHDLRGGVLGRMTLDPFPGGVEPTAELAAPEDEALLAGADDVSAEADDA
jgi:ribosome biogenesis GTPase A